MSRNRGNLFVGEVAVNCEIDHQTRPKRIKRILGRVTKVRELWDERVKEVPPVPGKSSCQNLFPLLAREKVLCAGVLGTQEPLVPSHGTMVNGADEPWYRHYLVRPLRSSGFSTSNDDSNMFQWSCLSNKENVLQLELARFPCTWAKPSDKAQSHTPAWVTYRHSIGCAADFSSSWRLNVSAREETVFCSGGQSSSSVLEVKA